MKKIYIESIFLCIASLLLGYPHAVFAARSLYREMIEASGSFVSIYTKFPLWLGSLLIFLGLLLLAYNRIRHSTDKFPILLIKIGAAVFLFGIAYWYLQDINVEPYQFPPGQI